MDGPGEAVPGSAAAPGRVLGVDLGTRRIGLALSDSAGVLASAHGVIERGDEPESYRAAICDLVVERGVVAVVVGLPIDLAGLEGPAASAVRDEVAALEAMLEVPVFTADERLTSAEATRRRLEVARLSDQARRGGRGGRKGPARPGARPRPVRRVVDDEAAAIMLQAWLVTRGAR